MQLTILPMGLFDGDLRVLTPSSAPGQRLRFPVYSYLIQSPNGLVLFDTGCSHLCQRDPRAILGEEVELLTPMLTADDHIEAQLALLGLQ